MDNDQYSKEEAEKRREEALKRMLSTPHKPHEPLGTRKKSGNGQRKKSQDQKTNKPD